MDTKKFPEPQPFTDRERPPIALEPVESNQVGAIGWTRERYRKAAHLSRYFARHVYDLPSDAPALLERYRELWARHQQGNDPLLLPLRSRRRFLDDDIPF